jgi:hypothetical protein
VVFPARQAHRGHERARGAVARRGRLAAVEQRQLDVLLRRGARQQVEALEDEAEVAAAQQGALVAVERLHRHAAEQVGAGGGRVQAAEDVHRGRLARAAGAHDGDELARSMSRSTPRSAWNGRCPAVDLGDAAQRISGAGRSARGAGSRRRPCALVGDDRHARLRAARR